MRGDQGLAQAEAAVAARHPRLQLEIFWFQARVLGDAGKHLGPDFLGVAERPSEFAPYRVGKLDVRGTLSWLYRPTGSEQGVEDFAGFCAGPVTHRQHAMDTSRGSLFFSFST